MPFSALAFVASGIEVWEWSGGFGFRRQLLVLFGSLLYDLFGASHVVFRLVYVVCWCAHACVYPRRLSPNSGRGLFTVAAMALEWHETAPGLLYEADGDSGRRYVVAFDGERWTLDLFPALRVRGRAADRPTVGQ